MTIKINQWTTANGANIELHTEHLTQETTTTDWDKKLVTEIDRIRIIKVIVNGKDYSTTIGRKTVRDTKVLDCGKDYSTKTIVYVAIPADVEKDVWSAYDARQKAAYNKDMNIISKNAEITKNKEARGYCSNCGSYCYGDCQS